MSTNDTTTLDKVIPVSIHSLQRNFGKTKALDNVSIEVPAGCVFGLVGANGAGKTTLIKHILGLLKVESGTIEVFGRDPIEDPEFVFF